MAQLRYLSGGVTLALDEGKCVGCRTCIEVCPHAVLALEDGKARIADRDACMECGACAMNCPADALSVESGVGCASGVILGALRGSEPCCGGPEGPACCG
ncbi:MAG: mercury methylation ferredoxin HgcB [Planctomycetota bacterium]|jgi:NAD-dependent dihydropyrimidine dehydrogenase PreA subunit